MDRSDRNFRHKGWPRHLNLDYNDPLLLGHPPALLLRLPGPSFPQKRRSHPPFVWADLPSPTHILLLRHKLILEHTHSCFKIDLKSSNYLQRASSRSSKNIFLPPFRILLPILPALLLPFLPLPQRAKSQNPKKPVNAPGKAEGEGGWSHGGWWKWREVYWLRERIWDCEGLEDWEIDWGKLPPKQRKSTTNCIKMLTMQLRIDAGK